MLILILLLLAAGIAWIAWCALVGGTAVWVSLKLLGLDDFENY